MDYPAESELAFEKGIVALYLEHGSVDELFKKTQYSLPISYPGVHRILGRWGIIKAAGPSSTLAGALAFLSRMAEEKIPLESLYKRMPPSFQPSLPTLHRIYGLVKQEVKKKIEHRNPRRFATALVISPNNDKGQILIAHDVSTPRVDVGKPYGSISLPMTFSKQGEYPAISIKRVLQQEVFTAHVLDREFPEEIATQNTRPFMFLDIADVRVAVYQLIMPRIFSSLDAFSSFKLKNYSYALVSQLASDLDKHEVVRAGVVDIAKGFESFLHKPTTSMIPVYDSTLNLNLAALAYNYV